MLLVSATVLHTDCCSSLCEEKETGKHLLQRRTVKEKNNNNKTGGLGTAVPEMCETNDRIFLLSAAVRCTRCRKHKQKLQ